NSKSLLNYHAVDENPLFGITLYRLKQTDFDGKYSYSNLVPVNIKSDQSIRIISLTGDEYSNSIHYFILTPTNLVNIEITDMLGNLVFRKNDADNSGAIDLSGVAHGMYLFRAFNENGSVCMKVIF